MRDLLETLAEGLWARIRSLTLAADRLDRLPENPGGVAPGCEAREEVAREFVLRMLRVAVDPVNYALLRQLVGESAVPLVELARGVNLPPLAVAERVADLVQVSLASRSLVGDQVQATAAASAVVELVEGVGQALSRLLSEREAWAR